MGDWSLAMALTMSGFFQGVTEPLCYELAAELMHPVKESTSAGILVFVLNTVAGFMIGANSLLTAASMNYIINGAVLVVLLSIAIGVDEVYRRPQHIFESISASL